MREAIGKGLKELTPRKRQLVGEFSGAKLRTLVRGERFCRPAGEASGLRTIDSAFVQEIVKY